MKTIYHLSNPWGNILVRGSLSEVVAARNALVARHKDAGWNVFYHNRKRRIRLVNGPLLRLYHIGRMRLPHASLERNMT